METCHREALIKGLVDAAKGPLSCRVLHGSSTHQSGEKRPLHVISSGSEGSRFELLACKSKARSLAAARDDTLPQAGEGYCQLVFRGSTQM